MRRACGVSLRPLAVVLLAGFVITSGTAVLAQGNGKGSGKNAQARIGLPEDWSQRHVIFSAPRNQAQTLKAQRSHRYLHQWLKQNLNSLRKQNLTVADAQTSLAKSSSTRAPKTGKGSKPPVVVPPTTPAAAPQPQGDWSYSLGSVAGARVAPNMFPAKYTYDVEAQPSCTDDFVVFPADKPGSTTQPSIVAFNNLYVAPATAASGTGTVSANSVAANQTVAIGSSTLYASAWTKAKQTGRFSAVPSYDAPALTVTNGTNTLSIKTNATQGNVTGTFSGKVTGSGAITLKHNAVTLTLTQGGTGGTCTGRSGNSISGTYNNGGNSTTLEASYFAQAVNACNTTYPDLGFVAANTTNSVLIKATTAGSSTDTYSFTSAVGPFTWGTWAAGTNGSNTCSGSTSATFAMSRDTTILAANVAAAINTCVPAVGVNAISGGDAITVTALNAGTVGNSIALAPTADNSGNFKWAATTLSGGSDGNTGTNFGYLDSAGNPVSRETLASNIASAINRNSTQAHAIASSNSVLLTANAAGASGNSIQLGGTATGLSWSAASLAGGTDVSGMCAPYVPSGAPTPNWAYNTGSGPVTTSPILSWDGTKVAYVESSATGSVLHVLRWKANEGTPAIPAIPGQRDICSDANQSCDIRIAYSTAANTNSSPFYDWDSDSIYVGDDNGMLYRINGVFNGTPALASGAWGTGISVHLGQKLTGPVYDWNTGNVIVGDDSGSLSAITQSGTVSNITLSSMTDAPIIDGFTGKVFAFTSGSVVQTDASLSSQVTVGLGAATQLHAGWFDTSYLTSTDPSAGHLYVCGGATPALYSIGFNSAGIMNASPSNGPLALASAAASCSPITNFYNSNISKEWLFTGVSNSCAFGGASTGCVMAFDITSGFPSTASATATSPGGTSGIVIDNSSPEPEASSVYYSTLNAATCGTGGSTAACAVKRTQQGLQ